MRWATRTIEAPPNDTLSRGEVASCLGYSDEKTVTRLVKSGEFPEPIHEGGKAKWFWEDVVWFMMHKRIRPRLRKSAEPTSNGAETDENTPEPTKPGTKGAKPGHSRVSREPGVPDA